MKPTVVASRLVDKPHSRTYPANAFQLACSGDDCRLAFGLIDMEDSEILDVEGSMFMTVLGMRKLHELLSETIAKMESQQPQTVQ